MGYSYVKDSYGGIFKSCMQEESAELSGGIEVNINGTDYLVGVGSGIMDTDKIDHDLTRVLMLADLYLCGGSYYDVVTGLPIAQYRKCKDRLKERVKSWNGAVVNGRRIWINNVEIFPQCAGALYSQDIQQDCIMVDIGGRTTDIGLFEYVSGNFNLISSNTLYDGMEAVYSDTIKAVNERHGLSLKNWQGEKIIRNGLTVDGAEQDTGFLKPILQKYADEIINELELHYPARTTKVLMCGGGAEVFGEYISNHLPSAETLDNGQFANAIGYHEVGKTIFEGVV